MTGLNLAILGDGVEAWLFAALFRQLSRRSGTLRVIPVSGLPDPHRIALPPVVNSAHQLLRIAPATLAAFGQPRYGIRIAGVDGAETLLPYGSYGGPEGPYNLVDAWIRLRAEDRAPTLASLSANRTLISGGELGTTTDPTLARSIDAGWDIDAGRYRALLADAALTRGVLHSTAPLDTQRLADAPQTLHLTNGQALDADIVIDASEGGLATLAPAPGWYGRMLSIGTAARRFDVAEPFAIAAVLSAAARLATLQPRLDGSATLAREYNRLLAVELVGMDCASAMIARLAGQTGPSETLDRYAARYQIAGLLPADPQPWTRDLWVSAFDAAGWKPQRYDPNIDRFDRDRSLRRFAAWKAALVLS